MNFIFLTKMKNIGKYYLVSTIKNVVITIPVLMDP